MSVSLHGIYASTSGHTEYVLGVVTEALQSMAKNVTLELQRAEQTHPEDFQRGDILLLACGTWNTGGSEGQLNPHMHELLRGRAAGVDLRGKQVLVIGLGDTRYHFTARAHDHLRQFVETHGGVLLQPTLRIVNEPYGQEENVRTWAQQISSHLRHPVA